MLPGELEAALRFPGHRFRTDWTRVEIDGEGRAVLPETVGDFLIGFDNGEFPALERPATANGGVEAASRAM